MTDAYLSTNGQTSEPRRPPAKAPKSSGYNAAGGPPGRQAQLAIKRAMDIVFSLAGLFALFPLFLLLAIAIRVESRGPVFFRQEREGLNGRVFRVFKFRSMRAEEGDISGLAQTTRDDTRVTRLGRFMRANSIDELPQLINVLTGEMSLVGPRPHVPGMLAAGQRYDELVSFYHDRHAMRPGITGLAQANGLRGPTIDAERAVARIEHDIAYIDNFNLLLDIKILVQTVRHEFIGGSAD